MSRPADVLHNSSSYSDLIQPPSSSTATNTDKSDPPLGAKDAKISVEAFLGGFLFSLQRIRQLCTDAFHFTDEMIDRKGPFITAQRFFDEFSPLDSPNFIPIVFAAEAAPTDWRRGYLLICRIAYVSPGEPIPNLPFDEQTEKYMEKWFPREVRESPPFKGIEYVEMMHPPNLPFFGCVERKLKECHKRGCIARCYRLLYFLEFEKGCGRTYTADMIPPLMPTKYVFSSRRPEQ